jgi:anti-sigma regulatory factor (Ser/Thr protein kinase)
MSGPALLQDSLDRLQWGDHVCHLFASAGEVGEVLVPYFKAGLDRNEACLWITSTPYKTDRAVSEMRAAVPDFDRRMKARQIQIFGHDDWYTKQGTMSAAETIRGWMSRKDDALASGYAGLRITGNLSFVDEGTWNTFLDYEQRLDMALSGQRILTLCSYCRPNCSADAIVEVMCAHGSSLTKRHDAWDLLDFKRPTPDPLQSDEQIGATGQAWTSIDTLFQDQLGLGRGRIELEGVPVQLSRKQATKLAMVVQELVANATRYGALSWSRGKVSVQWRLSTNGSRRLFVKWIESGSPNVPIPERTGFGTRLIAELVDKYTRVYEPRGLTCSFELDLGAE